MKRCLRFSLPLVALVSTLARAQDERPMTIDDFLDMVRIDDDLMTPDGDQVFFTERRLGWEKKQIRQHCSWCLRRVVQRFLS